MANFIQSAVGDSIARIKTDLQSVPKQIQSGLNGALTNAKNNTIAAARGAVNNAVNTGVNVAVKSAIEALGGNFTGALDTLSEGPANIFNNALTGLSGRSASSLSVSGPLQVFGTSSVASGNGGVSPGDGWQGINARSDPLMNFCWYCEMPVITSTQSTAGTNTVSSALNTGISELSSAVGLNGIFPITMSSGPVTGTAGAGGNAGATGQYELPWYFIEEATVPFRVFGTRQIFREGRDRHYVDKYSVDNLACTFYADTNNRSLDYLLAWNSNVLTPFTGASSITDGGHFGRPSQYKQVIRFYFLSVAKQQVAMVEYTECWPVSMDAIGLASDSSERLQYRVSFSVGDVFVTTFSVDPSAVAAIAQNPQLFPITISGAVDTIFNAGIAQAKSFASGLFP